MSAQQPTANGATSDADEEARIKDAMKRLKLLHIKVSRSLTSSKATHQIQMLIRYAAG